MPIDKLVAPLLRAPLFAGLKPLQITEIARQAERHRFRPGEIITRAGEPAHGAFLVAAGMADRLAEPGTNDMPDVVQPGSLIGELAMLVEHRYGSTVIARERVLCLKILRSTLLAQMQDDISLAHHFHRHIAERLSQVASELRRIDDALAACGAPLSPPGIEAPATEPAQPA